MKGTRRLVSGKKTDKREEGSETKVRENKERLMGAVGGWGGVPTSDSLPEHDKPPQEEVLPSCWDSPPSFPPTRPVALSLSRLLLLLLLLLRMETGSMR